jgi:hypothetical protein
MRVAIAIPSRTASLSVRPQASGETAVAEDRGRTLRFSVGRPHLAWQVDRARDDATSYCLVSFS